MATTSRAACSRNAMIAVSALAVIASVTCGYLLMSASASKAGWILVVAVVFCLAVGAGILLANGRRTQR